MNLKLRARVGIIQLKNNTDINDIYKLKIIYEVYLIEKDGKAILKYGDQKKSNIKWIKMTENVDNWEKVRLVWEYG